MNKKLKEFYPYLSPVNVFFVLMLVFIEIQFFYGEKIPIAGGLGWDGQIYGGVAKNFYHIVFVEKLPHYYVQRIFPSAIIHYILKIFHLPLNNQTVIMGFFIYNSSLVLFAIYLWGRITNELKFTSRMQWLAFIGLFCNFFILKQTFYYPVLTDITALFLSLSLLYCYLKKMFAGILALILIGAFTWPACIYFGLLLFIFPEMQEDHSRQKYLFQKYFNVIAATLISGLYLLMFFTLYQQGKLYPTENVSNFSKPLFPFSIFFIVIYLFLGSKSILNRYFYPQDILKYLNIKRLLTAGAVFFLINAVISGMGNPTHQIRPFYYGLLYCSVINPALFLVANIGYFGPIVIIAIFLWKPLCQAAHSYGRGLTYLLFVGFLMSIDVEARHAIFFFPFLIIFAVKATEGLYLSDAFFKLFILTSLLFSKIWMKINVEPFWGSFLEFPYQHYYMSHGPWMSQSMYLLQGAVILIIGFIFYCLYFRKTNISKSSFKNS